MSDVRLTFLGGVGEVTGSCHLLETGRHRILIDCGMFQGRREDDAQNAKAFPFDPASIDAVLLTHAHIDHSGRLPLLVKRGFKGSIFTHSATRDLLRIMLKDAAFLEERDTEWDNRKRARKGLKPVPPLFEVADVAGVLRRTKPVSYREKTRLNDEISFRLTDAGHILGSASLEIWVEAQGVSRKIVVSGDLGHAGAPLLRDPGFISEGDVVLMETTYGDRDHRGWPETLSEIGEIVGHAKATRGNILIPTFAVGRAQELLYLFARHFDAWDLKRWEIFLDSPMAIEATEVYGRHRDLMDDEAARAAASRNGLFSPPNLHISRTAGQSMRINTISSGAMILAGSGMCTGGRIRHHLKHNVWNPDNHVMIVGFQARGTLGRRLVDGAETITLWGEEIKVAAKIHTIGGLSAHAGARGLEAWASKIKSPSAFFLVHGEPEASEAMRDRLKGSLGLDCDIPAQGAQFDLARLAWVRRHGMPDP